MPLIPRTLLAVQAPQLMACCGPLGRRGYTHQRYRRIIDSVRRHMPDASVSGDAIVGFPGAVRIGLG